MKKFLRLLFLSFLSISSILCLTHLLFSIFFSQIHKRFKSDVSNQKADIVFFGSSRTANHIIPAVFDSISSTRSINMGVPGSMPIDINAQFKLYLKSNSAPKLIFLQIDHTEDSLQPSQLLIPQFSKYLENPELFNYRQNLSKKLIYIPLYKNIKFSLISWREILKTFFRNNSPINRCSGFSPIESKRHPNPFIKSPNYLIDSRRLNPYIQEIISICQTRKISIYLFTAPYFNLENPANFDNFKKYKVPYLNFSGSEFDNLKFSNRDHLNQSGAWRLSIQLAQEYKSLKLIK